VSSYRSTLKVHVLEAIGAKRLIDVTTDDVAAVLSSVRERRGPWANVVRTLRALFGAAIDAQIGGLKVSPVRVRMPKAEPSDKRIDTDEVATPAEVREMTEAMPEHLRIAVPLAAWCALRLGEVLGLQRRDLEHLDDPRRAVLHVRRQWSSKSTPPDYADPKRGSARSVAIPESMLADLRDHLERHAGAGRDGPILPSSTRPGHPVSQTAFDRTWRQARDTVRPGFRFHALRHTGLTEFARAGATLEELKKRGGHTNTEAALKYQHSTAERDRAITERLNMALEQ
jgi:integrase